MSVTILNIPVVSFCHHSCRLNPHLWQLAFYIVYLPCGIYMQEWCPACGAPIVSFRLDISRKNAAADQTFRPDTSVPLI
jgi:hypothetical protein